MRQTDRCKQLERQISHVQLHEQEQVLYIVSISQLENDLDCDE